MVGILVDHDLVATPVPVPDDVVIEGGDVPEVVAEPEAFPIPAREVEYVLRSETTPEMSVCPRLSDVVMRIVSATIVADPSIVPGVNVRNVRMTSPVHFHVVLSRRLPAARWGRSARRRGRSRGSRPARRNVSAADRWMTAAAARSAIVLPKSSHAKENR